MGSVVKDATRPADPSVNPDELEHYRRLVEVQSQIVELARLNREMEQHCRVLQQRVAREAEDRRKEGFPIQLRNRLVRWLRFARSSLAGRDTSRNATSIGEVAMHPTQSNHPVPAKLKELF